MGCCSTEKDCECESKSTIRGKVSMVAIVAIVLVVLVIINWQ